MIITPATTSELGEALSLLHGPTAEDVETRDARAAQLLASGKLALDDVLVARKDGVVCGAVFSQLLPGTTGLLWPARSPGTDPAIEDALNTAALEHIGSVKLVQAFLTPEELDRAESLKRCGFQHITRIWEMRRASLPFPPASRAALPVLAREIGVRPFAEVDHRTFHQILLRCHEDSLDCPEIQEHRTPDEVLAGYLDCAPDTNQWWIAEASGGPVGVLLLAGLELIFVGVVPARRGQGFGRTLVEAACEKSSELSLVVDVRNIPAVQLYLSVGFEVVGAREVFLKMSPCQHTPSARKSSNAGE